MRPGPRLRRGLCAAGALVWMGALSLASHAPGDDLPPAPMAGFDKVEHGLAWALLGALAAGALAAGRARWRLLLAVALAIGFGAIDELHQATVPGRDSSLADLLADAVGASVGAGLVAWWPRRAGAIGAGPASSE